MPPPKVIACTPRSPESLAAAITSLQAETNPRYRRRVIPGAGMRTFCNVFVEDLCELMSVHLPKGLLARQQIAWLASAAGRAVGWFEASPGAAGAHALRGRPVLVGWTNPVVEQSSHIAILRAPGRIAQAGSTNFSDGTIAKGFGTRQVCYYGHL